MCLPLVVIAMVWQKKGTCGCDFKKQTITIAVFFLVSRKRGRRAFIAKGSAILHMNGDAEGLSQMHVHFRHGLDMRDSLL